MTDESSGIGLFVCPCKSCILSEAFKLEQKKQFKEADTLMSNGLRYYSAAFKELDNERKKFRSRMKQNSNISSSIDNASMLAVNMGSEKVANSRHCQYASHRSNSKAREFTCPIAIFDDVPDPNLKPMYPKNLVYLNGNDNQLEEIRAARYWAKNQPQDIELPANVKEIMSTEQLIVSAKGIELSPVEPVKSPAIDLTNLVKNTHVIPDPRVNCCPTQIENIDPIASSLEHPTPVDIPKIFKEPKSILKLSNVHEKSDDTSQIENQLFKNVQMRNRKSSVKNERTENINVSNNTDDDSLKPVLKTTETAISNENSNNIPQSGNKSSNPTPILSRIPSLKSLASRNTPAKEVEKVEPEVKPLPSSTFVVARTCPSQTYIVNTDLIEKETITLVDDIDDDNNVSGEYTCSTRAFRVVLPSSTPNKRKSQFFKPTDPNANGTYVTGAVPPVPNLSMILEISKERYSSSSGTSNNLTTKSFIPSQKTPLTAIGVTKGNENLESTTLIPDPFDVDLITQLLHEAKFPREQDNGYHKFDHEMGQMKLSSTVKLGNSKYCVCGEIGKGSYARILKLQDMKDSKKVFALKQQKPACLWEFYISKEIQQRLQEVEKKVYFIDYSDIYVYRNGSAMVSEWAPYGSILNFVNNLKSSHKLSRCPNTVVVWLSIQFVEIIRCLHSCSIIHGDVKPDNFVLCNAITTNGPSVKLIDYGRSIDMSILPKNSMFTKVVATEDFTCNEMKDNRPWTYQTDLFGLAGTMYLLLVNEYMKTTKRTDGRWTLTKNLPRYVNRDLWNPIFDTLLNIPSCKELPDLLEIQQRLEENFKSVEKRTVASEFAEIKKIIK